MAYLVRLNRDGASTYVEYETRQGAEEAAEFLVSTQGGAVTVFATEELGSRWWGDSLRARAKAQEHLDLMILSDTHSSDVDPGTGRA